MARSGTQHAGARRWRRLRGESPYWGLPETGVERGVFLTAEVLYHELLHVLIAIGRQLETLSPGFTGHSATFERYREVMSAATGPGYADLQSKISTGLMGLGLIVRRDLGLTFSNAAIGTWAAEGYEFFVQEKVAFKETGKRFRSSPANAVVAQAYVGNQVRKMLAGTGMDGILYRRLQALPAYADAESAVVADVRELLNGIDTDPALTGEFVPGLMVPSQPGHDAPPLSIGGEPVH